MEGRDEAAIAHRHQAGKLQTLVIHKQKHLHARGGAKLLPTPSQIRALSQGCLMPLPSSVGPLIHEHQKQRREREPPLRDPVDPIDELFESRTNVRMSEEGWQVVARLQSQNHRLREQLVAAGLEPDC
jgi:hypothetical protein